MLKKVMAFKINAHLKQENGDTFYFPFTVVADKDTLAEKQLEKYLKENKEDTNLKYKEVVGFRILETEHIIMNVSDDL